MSLIKVGDLINHLPTGKKCTIIGLTVTKGRNGTGEGVDVPSVAEGIKDENRVTFTLSNGESAHSWQCEITDHRICYDIIWHGRVVDMYTATSADEALDKWRGRSDTARKISEGLYGYHREGGNGGPVAKPSSFEN